jgi:phage terminase large subunit-like protein
MPDSLVIEAKATGTTLIQSLCGPSASATIESMPAHRGNDMVTRTNAVADIFSSGGIWAPLRCSRARGPAEQMSSLPYGESNDWRQHDLR